MSESEPCASSTAGSLEPVLVGRKRKQLSLDVLFPKRRSVDNQQDSNTDDDNFNVVETTAKNISHSSKDNITSSSLPSDTSSKTESYPFDIGSYINRVSTLSDAEKYDLLCKVWKPEEDCSFPTDKKSGRRFQHHWFPTFPWLCYSAVANGGF